jgi:hypothetical protein
MSTKFIITLDTKGECRLYGPPDASPEHFGFFVADIIRHVANHFGIDPSAVIDAVGKELDKPGEVRRVAPP